MKKILFGVLIVVLLLGSGGCARQAAVIKKPLAVVMVKPVEKGTVVIETTLPATVLPEQTARLLAQVEGEVLALPHREGDPVRAGEVLVTIDPSRLQAAHQEASAEQDLVRIELEESRRVLERDRTLFARRGLAEEGLERSQTNVATGEARLRQAEARVATIQAQLDDTEVRAPFNGYVLERWVELGDVVGVHAPLLSVASTRLIVAARVSELDVPSLDVGIRVGLMADAARAVSSCPGCTGIVSRVYPKIDPTNRATTAEIVPEPACAARLRPGMFVRVTLVKDQRDNVIIAPAEAMILRPNGDAFVYVVDGEVAHERNIRVGLEGRDTVEILDGLGIGERVIVRGQEKLKNGAPVKVAGSKNPVDQAPPEEGEGQRR